MAKKELKKHAAMIHCVNSLSLLQRKISNVLLYHAYPSLQTQEEYEVTMDYLCKLLGITTRNYDALKTALRTLVQTVLEWNIVSDDTGEEDWTATTVLASVRIKNGLCYYAYSPRMRALLSSPSIYGKINLLVQSRFRSSYGLALYENCARYRGISGTKSFKIEEFRKLMGLPDDQYPIFRDLKKRVIDKAVDEVNLHSDMRIESQLRRAGRRVISIKFLISDRPRMPKLKSEALLESPQNAQQENSIIRHQLCKEFKINELVADKLLNDYSTDYIQEKIGVVLMSSAFKNRKIHDVAGYLVAAIKDNYQPYHGVDNFVATKHQEALQQEMQAKAVKSKEEALMTQYAEYKKKQFFESYFALSSEQQLYLKEAWLESLREKGNLFSNSILKEFQHSEFVLPKVYTSFMGFIKNEYPQYFPNFLALEEYLEQEKTSSN